MRASRLDGVMEEKDVAIATEVITSKLLLDEKALSETLKEVLLEAQEQNRLTCGIYECGQLLEMNPDGIMVCIVPENTSNVDVHIYLTLIEALCWENIIRVIKVDSLKSVAHLLVDNECTGETGSDSWSSNSSAPVTDFNCVLIEYPIGQCSAAEEKLLDFHNCTCDVSPQPIIPLHV